MLNSCVYPKKLHFDELTCLLDILLGLVLSLVSLQFSALTLTPELLEAVECLHLLHRTREEIPILEKERSSMISYWGMSLFKQKYTLKVRNADSQRIHVVQVLRLQIWGDLVESTIKPAHDSSGAG